MLRRDLNVYMSQIEDGLGCFCWSFGVAVERVTPSVPNQNWFLNPPGQTFSFYSPNLKQNNSLHHWNTFNPKRPAKRTACTLIRTLKQVFVLIKLSTHTHSKHKVNVHALLSPQKTRGCVTRHSNSTWRTHGNMSSLKFWPVKDSTSNRTIHLSIKHTLSSRLLPIRNLKNGLYFSTVLLCLFGIAARHFSKHTFILILTWVLNASSEWSGISHCIARQRQSNDFDMSKKIK